MRKAVITMRGIFRSIFRPLRDFFVVRRRTGRVRRKEKMAPREKVRKRVEIMKIDIKRERFPLRFFRERRAGARRRLPMNWGSRVKPLGWGKPKAE